MASGKILGNLAIGSTAFFVCDIQERFRPAIKYFKEIVEVAKRMVDASKILDIPLVVTEQYPKGLGSTVTELDINPTETEIFPKTVFSMVIPEVEEKMKTICNGELKSIVLFGIEAHVCVQQTTLDLLGQGYEVHLVADATSSRSQMDRLFAYERLRQAGAIITTSEAILLQLMGGSKHPKFKEVQALIKSSAPTSGLVIEDRLVTDVNPNDEFRSSAKI